MSNSWIDEQWEEIIKSFENYDDSYSSNNMQEIKDYSNNDNYNDDYEDNYESYVPSIVYGGFHPVGI